MPSLRILFVDDEMNVLSGLQRMLRPMRHEWDMRFAGGGLAALSELEAAPFDIISDMRMPGMDGSELLNIVRERHPSMVRIALSGHSDQATALRSVGPTHQFLSKPCDSDTLLTTIKRAGTLCALASDDGLAGILSRIESLPSLPESYRALEAELRSPEPSIQAIGRIIARDIGMSAKVLQLVNSAFFGLPRHVSSPELATSLLGIETIRALVLSVHAFSQINVSRVLGFSPEAVWGHSLKVAQRAQAVARAEGCSAGVRSDALTAGLLHDAGKLVLAANLPEEYRLAVEAVDDCAIDIWQSERMVFGVTHAEVGAYLLGLWGLPAEIVDAVANHHAPLRSRSDQFGVLGVVHVADGIESCAPELDHDYLERVGRTADIEAWRKASEKPAVGSTR